MVVQKLPKSKGSLFGWSHVILSYVFQVVLVLIGIDMWQSICQFQVNFYIGPRVEGVVCTDAMIKTLEKPMKVIATL